MLLQLGYSGSKLLNLGVDGVDLISVNRPAGLLPGITREFIFEVGRDVGVPVREQVLRDDDLWAVRVLPDEHHEGGSANRTGGGPQDRKWHARPGHEEAARGIPPPRLGYHEGWTSWSAT